ncbi:MAG: DUF1259 domain-containing protein [Gemmatimonadaceae bacterium]
MRQSITFTRTARRVAIVTAFCALTADAAFAQQAASAKAVADWSALDQALGRKGAAQPGDVMKYSFPRGDMQVTVNGVQLKPALALGSWVAFKRVGKGQAMAMGDLVLAEQEVGPVMKALQAGGIEQTALHNHLQMESPRVMYMHVSAHGDAAKIATTIRSALGQTATPMEAPSAPALAAAIDLDTAALAQALGSAGKVNGGVYQVSFPRSQRVTDHGMEIPPSMGVATAINFQPTGGGKAAITGDFVMIASEVNPVIRALEANDITVTAVHSHMLTESPRLFFMHFWANDDATTLARGLRAALDKMAVKPAAKKTASK